MWQRTTLSLLLLGSLALPAVAAGPQQSLRFHLGSFRPEGDSQYWQDKEDDFTRSADDFEDAIGGIDYRIDLGDHWGVLFSGSAFETSVDQSYRDFEDSRGLPVAHTTTLEVSSATVGVVFHFSGPGAAVRPYVGAGGGVYVWRLEEDGRFIDFTPPPPTIFRSTSVSEGEAFGRYLLAGIEVPISSRIGLFAEGRWHDVDDELDQDFEGFGTIDLSGRQASAGVSIRF
jgi:Outer membrane protein beta-barrel domain